MIFQHDNATPYIVKVDKEQLQLLKWDVILHLAYSLGIVPSDYHLFLSMQHGLSDEQFSSCEDIEKRVDVNNFKRNGFLL